MSGVSACAIASFVRRRSSLQQRRTLLDLGSSKSSSSRGIIALHQLLAFRLLLFKDSLKPRCLQHQPVQLHSFFQACNTGSNLQVSRFKAQASSSKTSSKSQGPHDPNLNLSCVLLLSTLFSRSNFPLTAPLQSSQSAAISINTFPITCALAMRPCCSPSKILTSHFRINRPNHLTLSTGTRLSLLPWWMTTARLMSS